MRWRGLRRRRLMRRSLFTRSDRVSGIRALEWAAPGSDCEGGSDNSRNPKGDENPRVFVHAVEGQACEVGAQYCSDGVGEREHSLNCTDVPVAEFVGEERVEDRPIGLGGEAIDGDEEGEGPGGFNVGEGQDAEPPVGCTTPQVLGVCLGRRPASRIPFLEQGRGTV